MEVGFVLYLVFVISWFLHISARIPVLGAMRVDLVLVILLAGLMIASQDRITSTLIGRSETHKTLKRLILYVLLTLPLVQWPGSVLQHGAEVFLKATVFYYFSIYFIKTEKQLRGFVTVFLLCQTFRVVEPVYLHVTQGYWGSFASMAAWQYMDRLSGAPRDIVNPNGLASVILIVIPFWYYLGGLSKAYMMAASVIIPLSVYALLLTGSRSGVVGLILEVAMIYLRSEKKAAVLALIVAGLVTCVSLMQANFVDRYKSIFVSGTKNDASAEGRITGVKSDFAVAMERPLFGFGLGTSSEANANFGGTDKPSHNLYTEVAQELGFIGLIFFTLFLKSIILTTHQTFARLKQGMESKFITSLTYSLQAWLYMNVLFSFASYGLSSYEWYLFAGVSVVLERIFGCLPLSQVGSVTVADSGAVAIPGGRVG